MITKEEFEDGVVFRDDVYARYKFEPTTEDEDIPDPGCITRNGQYLCNVKKITKVGFTFYVYILGHRIAKKVKFKDLVKP